MAINIVKYFDELSILKLAVNKGNSCIIISFVSGMTTITHVTAAYIGFVLHDFELLSEIVFSVLKFIVLTVVLSLCVQTFFFDKLLMSFSF